MAKGTLEVGGTAEGGKMASLEVEQSATGGVAGALIVDNNETEVAIPAVLAGFATGLEYIGLKGVTKYIASKPGTAARFTKLL